MERKLKEKLTRDLISIKFWFAMIGLCLLLDRRIAPEHFIGLVLGLVGAREYASFRYATRERQLGNGE